MHCPRTCGECPYFRRCTTAMYTEGCVFYPPGTEPVKFSTRVKEFFKSWFK